MGPTAAGKTELALELVRRFPCDIVSVDSALVYRGMDVGTAKPGPNVLSWAPHRLIDICDPAENYSAGHFQRDALREMNAIGARGRIPLLVGGTMLYFRALQQGLAHLPEADAAVRARLDEEARRFGLSALHARLREVDPVAAARIHPNDPQRIQRALEVYELTGVALTELCQRAQAQFPYSLMKLIVAPADRSLLHARIETRFRAMLKEGFIEEVEKLRARPDLHTGLPSMRAVGYRQIWAYLEGQATYDEMVERAIIATRQLAKRQLTWLRSEPDAEWFDTARSMAEKLAGKVEMALVGVSDKGIC